MNWFVPFNWQRNQVHPSAIFPSRMASPSGTAAAKVIYSNSLEVTKVLRHQRLLLSVLALLPLHLTMILLHLHFLILETSLWLVPCVLLWCFHQSYNLWRSHRFLVVPHLVLHSRFFPKTLELVWRLLTHFSCFFEVRQQIATFCQTFPWNSSPTLYLTSTFQSQSQWLPPTLHLLRAFDLAFSLWLSLRLSYH